LVEYICCAFARLYLDALRGGAGRPAGKACREGLQGRPAGKACGKACTESIIENSKAG